ncbi:hypothetical protein HOLleu_20516 [Holothuria leucospilota]|uniref:Uncharacterized protein n=1 Tax=Holothuria leucospilota TaxID=206669 RepID=A0A9Q1C1L3_HOLLE|nr:hypothetical protein HOLleu_20516 [Holothuria leucospilota]
MSIPWQISIRWANILKQSRSFIGCQCPTSVTSCTTVVGTAAVAVTMIHPNVAIGSSYLVCIHPGFILWTQGLTQGLQDYTRSAGYLVFRST